MTTTITAGATTGSITRVVEPREYLVFGPTDHTIKEGGYESGWLVIGSFKTLTPEDALTQANAMLPADEQNVTTLVPVAARNWQPRTPKVEESPPPKVVWS